MVFFKKQIFKITLLVASLSLSPIIIAEINACSHVTGERSLLNCYNQHQQIIPIAKSRLPEGQQLTDSYRCGTRLLQLGMTVNEVQTLCPTSQQPDNIEHYLQSFEIHHRGYYGVHYVSLQTYKMEKWTYKRYGRFRTYIIFRDGMIYQIIQDRSVRN